MNFQRLLTVPLFAGLLFMTVALCFSSAVTAQDKVQAPTTDQSKPGTTPAGFPTGSRCVKTGTYKAENKYLKVVMVVAEGEEFPPFADGEATTWYALAPSTKTFEAVKTVTDPK